MNIIKRVIDAERPDEFCSDSLSASDIGIMLDRIEDAVIKSITELEAQRDEGRKWVKEAHELAAIRIAELEAQVPKVVTPVDGKCPNCGGWCGWNYCMHCGAKLEWT